jgi:hypothetical protein
MLMGGFYFDNDSSTEPQFLPGSPNLILTSAAIQFLDSTLPPLLPDISNEVRGLCDVHGMSKVFAFVPAVYQDVSIIFRLAGKVLVSQLEIITFGQILWSSTILVQWIDKPKNLKVRAAINVPWSRPVCAYLWMCSSMSAGSSSNIPEIAAMFPMLKPAFSPAASSVDSVDHTKSHDDDDPTPSKEETCGEGSISSRSAARLRRAPKFTFSFVPKGPSDKPNDDRLKDNNEMIFTEDEWDVPKIGPMLDTAAFAVEGRKVMGDGFQEAQLIYTNPAMRARAILAMQYFTFWHRQVRTATKQYWSPESPAAATIGFENFETPDYPPLHETTLLTDHVSDWYRGMRYRFWVLDRLITCGMIASASGCYGMLCAAAWYSHFPTELEATAWHASSIVITSAGFLVALDQLTSGISFVSQVCECSQGSRYFEPKPPGFSLSAKADMDAQRA